MKNMSINGNFCYNYLIGHEKEDENIDIKILYFITAKKNNINKFLSYLKVVIISIFFIFLTQTLLCGLSRTKRVYIAMMFFCF